jgi:hypothetical protein
LNEERVDINDKIHELYESKLHENKNKDGIVLDTDQDNKYKNKMADIIQGGTVTAFYAYPDNTGFGLFYVISLHASFLGRVCLCLLVKTSS